ncbi:hypothetical protein CHUAL_003322 [Chamberlinius hualienensis]
MVDIKKSTGRCAYESPSFGSSCLLLKRLTGSKIGNCAEDEVVTIGSVVVWIMLSLPKEYVNINDCRIDQVCRNSPC